MTNIHLYKMTTWESVSGRWFVNDVTNLSGRSAKWYTPMRILSLSVEEYINLLINSFGAKGLQYYPSTDFLTFYFDTEKEAKSFCSYINKIAKQKRKNN